jgi:hypothetical protein
MVPHEEYLKARADLLTRDEWIIDGYRCVPSAWERFAAADTFWLPIVSIRVTNAGRKARNPKKIWLHLCGILLGSGLRFFSLFPLRCIFPFRLMLLRRLRLLLWLDLPLSWTLYDLYPGFCWSKKMLKSVRNKPYKNATGNRKGKYSYWFPIPLTAAAATTPTLILS